MHTLNYYQILNIEENSDLNTIKSAFRKEIRACHPDVDRSDKAKARFKLVVEAFDVLSDDEKRRIYDRYLAEKKLVPALAVPETENKIKDWQRDSEKRSKKFSNIDLEELLLLGFIIDTGFIDGILDGTGGIIDSLSDALDGLGDLF